ncbi:MAG: DUF1624 domain-containing protein [Spirochaetales bacterium]|nr:DUF1624 domain-containing protein [Spirochaetales bacterium]
MNRYWEVDAFRGLAIVSMIIFHVFYLVVFFAIAKIDLWTGFFWWFPRIIAGTFIFTVGLSLTLSHARVKADHKNTFNKYLLRGLSIFGFGMIITIVTFIAFLILENITGEEQLSQVVYFGILHCIGISIIIGSFFLRFRIINIIIGVAVLIAGNLLNSLRFDFPWLLWLGFWPQGYYPVDYEPLLPWIALFFFGLAFGNIVYKNGTRPSIIPELGSGILTLPFRGLGFMGRHSLLIYLVHIPALAGIIYGIKSLIELF